MKYTTIVLSGDYHDGPGTGTAALGARKKHRFEYHRFFELTARIRRSRRVGTVLIDHRSDFSPSGFAAVEAIRRELISLAEGGKRLIFCCEDCDMLTLFLASACDTRVIHPVGELRVLGIARRFLFIKKTLDRFGVNATVIRRGRYKSAGDLFRTDSLDPANREQYETFYGEAHERIVETISRSTGKSRADIDVLLSGHVLPAEQAVSHGWLTEVATVHELHRRLRDQKRKERTIKLHGKFGRGARVAVIFLDGAVCDGESRRHPVLGNCVGDRTIAGQLRELSDDKKIKAVVLRVNSPGGSAVASESIRRELAHLHKKKPIVVSMANVAGSGGYWVSTEADRVFAESMTLTGSIGVLLMLLEVEKPLKNYGVTSDVIETGRFAELGSPLRKLSREEQHLLDTRVEQLYEDFIRRAADARNQTPERIEAVAAGRVWSGAAATGRGLVDEIGGLDAALTHLREKLGKKKLAVRMYPKVKSSLLERVLLKHLPASPMGASRVTTAPAVIGELHRKPLAVVPELLFDSLTISPGEVSSAYSTSYSTELSM